MPKICPHCGSRAFGVTAHVTQDWVVDEFGAFLNCTNECVEVQHWPDDSDIWDCANCFYSASGRDFEEECVAQQFQKQILGQLDEQPNGVGWIQLEGGYALTACFEDSADKTDCWHVALLCEGDTEPLYADEADGESIWNTLVSMLKQAALLQSQTSRQQSRRRVPDRGKQGTAHPGLSK